MGQTRPPIVTILGHVDHGKTSLLDYIRKSSVAQKEHGGITQHIGAYQVEHDKKLITFIDTPGHAAFEKMRSRGANVADIAILVVAIDDGVMPQTIEAIKHIQKAKVPMIVAINKCDLIAFPSPGGERKIDFSNTELKIAIEKIKRQLSDNKVLIEEYGGEVPIVPLSAKTGEGVEKLLEIILLISEMNELKGDPNLPPTGVVIEANLDKFKGSVATLLIRNGSLKKGDLIVLGGIKSKIRGMFDYNGKAIDIAGPSTPVEVLGLEDVPMVGAILGEEKEGQREKEVKSLIDKLRQDKTAVLNVVVRADKQGSLEAILTALEKFNKEGEHLKVVFAGTGDIIESDIELASATHSIVIGFNVKVMSSVSKMADSQRVLVRTYAIIYELLDEIEEVMADILEKGALEEIFGTAQILAEFPFGKNERIAGCKVIEGQISRGAKVRIVRDEGLIAETRIKSMRKGKEEVSRLEKGDECGLMFEPIVDFRVGDLVQSFRKL